MNSLELQVPAKGHPEPVIKGSLGPKPLEKQVLQATSRTLTVTHRKAVQYSGIVDFCLPVDIHFRQPYRSQVRALGHRFMVCLLNDLARF
jgi:hypothetical protein